MFNKRSTAARRRLRIEFLEDRSVPAGDIGLDIDVVDVPPVETPPDVIVQEEVVSDPKSETDVIITLDDVLVDPVADGEVIALESSLDGDPPASAVDLAAFTTVDKLKPSIGDIVTVKVTVSNNGDAPGTGVTVAATLPEGLTFVSADPGQGTYDSATGEWSVGTVYPGGPATLLVKATVADPAAKEVTASITAADQPDSNAENNSANASVEPVLANVKLTTSVSSPKIMVGGTVVYTLTIKNAGPGAARNIQVTDTLGAGLSFVRFQTPTRGSYNPATNIWSIKKLAPNSAATLRIVASVKKVGRLESSATLTATGLDVEKSTVDSVATVTGTKVNNPTTWSYTALGSNPGSLPVPVKKAKSASPATLSPFALAMQMANANMLALQALLMRLGA
jgi:uncharacterized repeat protein (TIGR01451 family)